MCVFSGIRIQNLELNYIDPFLYSRASFVSDKAIPLPVLILCKKKSFSFSYSEVSEVPLG